MKIRAALAVLAATCATAFSLSLPVSEDTSSTAGRGGFTLSAVSGRAATLAVSPKNNAYLYFDLAGLPATATAANVLSARLRIYIGTVRKPGTIELREAADDWNEDEIKPVPEPGVVLAVPAIAQIQNLVRKRFVIVDVTATIKAWLANPTANNGFAIITPTGQITSVLLGAKEGSGSGYPAELEIDTNPVAPLFLGGDPSSGFLNGASIATGTIGSLQLGAGSVGTINLTDASVTSPKLADGAVSAAKLAAGSVGGTALAEGGVGTINLADSSVTAPKLAAGAVGTAAIVDGAVSAEKIAPNAVANSIGDGKITGAKLADGSVTSTKLAPGSVTPTAIGSVPAVRVTGNVTQTLVRNIENALQWNAELFDAVDSHSNSTNNSRLHASVRGLYLVHVKEYMVKSVGGLEEDFTLSIWRNGVGTGTKVSDAPIGGLTDQNPAAFSQLVQMNAGDYIEASANIGSNGGLDSTVNRSQNSFTMVLLAPLP